MERRPARRPIEARCPQNELKELFLNINNGYRVLIMMRGLPGSGKSTLADFILERCNLQNKRAHILGADDFFHQRGKYQYDVTKLTDAHSWNQRRAKDCMTRGFSPIIIDNTHTEAWEMQCYVIDGVTNGYIIKILEPQTDWAFVPRELAHKNRHGVPIQKIKKMSERYVKNITAEQLLQSWKLIYTPPNMPPMLRSSPRIISTPKENESTSFVCIKKHISPERSLTLIADKPKPQRSQDPNKTRQRGLLNSESVDWQPINETIDIWQNNSKLNGDIASNSSKISLKCDSSTNTQSCDLNSNNWINFKTLRARSREINEFSSGKSNTSPKMFSTFDKSTMTEEINAIWGETETDRNSNDYRREVEELKSLFPDVSVENLRHILFKCNGDINWTVEILLDSKNEGELIQLETKMEEDCIIDSNSVQVEENFNTIDDIDLASESLSNESDTVKPIEEVDKSLFKREIEKNFVFSDDHYSDHVLKIKRRNRGEKPISNEEIPGSASSNDSNEMNRKMSVENVNDLIENDVVSLNVGTQFIEELENIFDSSYDIRGHLEPIIHMPMSLVHQIHALWLESVYDQIDTQQEYLKVMIKEDEEFARNLEMVENSLSGNSVVTVQETPNLKEIMDMEMALALYKTNMEELKKVTPDDLASRLTRQKLVELFPHIENYILFEVLSAHDHNFEQTVQVLIVSTGQVKMSNDEEENKKAIQQVLMKHEKDLLERAKREKEKAINESSKTFQTGSFDDKVALYKQEASRHLEIRNSNYVKAQEYLRKGMTQVASYYSSIAALHTKRHDFASTMAATEIAQKASTNNDFTIDLHQMNVIEAIKVLDLFLDRHIMKIQKETRTRVSAGFDIIVKLFLVTGRGRHSPGGQPKIKPAVSRRLRERRIRHNEINPGLLGVHLTAEDQVAGDNAS